MPITIQSPEQSFVQFNAQEILCGNYPERHLPAEKFDIAFQFIVSGSIAKTNVLKAGIASINCQLIDGLNFGQGPIQSICDKRVINIPEGSFFLKQITFNGLTKVYNIQADKIILKQKLVDDFEATIIGDDAVLECCDNTILILINPDGSFNEDFSDDFDTGGGNTLETFLAWHYVFFEIKDTIINIPVNSCFRYAILDQNDIVIECSNSFIVSDDTCYTSIITYKNDEDSFGFLYGESIYNKIRLPFFLKSPTNPVVKKVYRKSNAQYKTTTAVYDREYALVTDWMPDWFHEKLALALGHDYVKIESGLFNVNNEVSVEQYSPEWTDDDTFLLAQGKAKVKHAKYSYKNNSCGVKGCIDYIPPVIPPVDPPVCVPVSIIGSPSIPHGIQGHEFNYTIYLSGTPDFTLSNIVKPSWMNITLTGDHVNLFGTCPDVISTDNDVSFKVTNACGNVDYADQFSVIATGNAIIVNGTVNSSRITSVTGIAGFALSADLTAGRFERGTHDAFTGSITVAVTIPPSPHRLQFIINGVSECINLPASGSYSNSEVTLTEGDAIVIVLSPSNC